MYNMWSSERFEQEAQLPQRDSASATRVFLGSLTDRTLHLTAFAVVQLSSSKDRMIVAGVVLA